MAKLAKAFTPNVASVLMRRRLRPVKTGVPRDIKSVLLCSNLDGFEPQSRSIGFGGDISPTYNRSPF